MAVLLRRTRRGAARALRALALPAVFLLSGCADTPPEYNPLEWGRSAARGVGSLFEGPPPGSEPPPAEGRPYPNLATVPRPPKVAPRAEREAELARLQADQSAASDADRQLRGGSTVSTAPPLPPAITTSPAPPPAISAAPPPAPTIGDSPPLPAAIGRAPAPAPAAPRLASPVPSDPPAAPAPATPPAVAQAQPPAAAIMQRVGAVAFAREGSTLSATGERALASAATLARTRNGRVRLVPAQVARQAPSAEMASARREAIVQALGRAGLARERVRIDDGGGRRVDVYDLYVEY